MMRLSQKETTVSLMRISQKRDYGFLDAAFTNMYSTMANFYDYYVSNDSEENEGQAKAARMDFKTRSRDKRSENESPPGESSDGAYGGRSDDVHGSSIRSEKRVPVKVDKGLPVTADKGFEAIEWNGCAGGRCGSTGELRGNPGGEWNGRTDGGGWADKAVDDCSHIYSDGTSVNSLFDTRQEKIAVMNMIAILAYSYNVKILVQQVMTTHVHLIVSGTAWDRERFARELRRRLILWAADRKHSANATIMVGNDAIRSERELMNKFMYVYRNAIVAGYPGMPWEYVGGPGNIFFAVHEMKGGCPVSKLTEREKRATFRTRVKIPAEWRFNEEGLILPWCYVDVARVERLFKSPKVFIAFLSQSKKIESEIDMECSREYVRVFSERELQSECKELFLNMFGKVSASRANLEERLAVARKVWGDKKTFSISSLSRVTLVPQSVLETIFGKKS